MGNNRPLKTKCWIKFLEAHGYVITRVKSSHHIYTRKGIRPIPVWGNEKEVPAFHIRAGCRTLEITIDEVYNWVDKNC